MTDWVIRLIDYGGYAGVFLLMLLETVFPPIPSEVILPVAGLRAANGPMALGGVILSGTAGAMTGNLFWYVIARSIGFPRFRRFIERRGRWLTLDLYDIERVWHAFHRVGAVIVFIGRMLPTLRTFISVPAGLVHMRLVRFLLWSTAGTALWSAVLATAGYLLGLQFGRVEEVAGPVSSAIVAALVLWYVWRQLTWNRRHLKRAGVRSDTHP